VRREGSGNRSHTQFLPVVRAGANRFREIGSTASRVVIGPVPLVIIASSHRAR